MVFPAYVDARCRLRFTIVRSSWHEVYFHNGMHVSRKYFPLKAKYNSIHLAVCTPNLVTLWISRQWLCCHSEATKQDEGTNKQESPGVQREMPSSTPGKNNARNQYMLGTNQLESSSAEENFGVLSR